MSKKNNYHGLSHNHLGQFNVNLISNSENTIIQKSNSHIVFSLDSTHQVPINENMHYAVGLSTLCLPFTWYDIRLGTNDTFTITVDAVSEIITIPPGNYDDAYIFAGELNILFSALYQSLGVLITVSVDEKLAKFNFSLTETVSSISFSNVLCYRQIGFEKNITYSLTDVSSFSSPNVFNFSGSPCVYICLPSLNIQNPTSGQQRNGIIACIPIEVYPNYIQFFKTETPQMFMTKLSQVNNLEIQILDEDFNDLELNGSVWRLSLTFEYRNDFISDDVLALINEN